MLIAAAILILLLSFSWLRVVRPSASAPTGPDIMTYPIPLLARLRMQAMPASVAVLLGGALRLYWHETWLWMAVVAVSTLLLLGLPMRYTLTSNGIRMSWTTFRRWTEFAGVRRATGGARLVGGHKQRDLHIWLSGSRGDDEFLLFMKQMIQDAYKGNAMVIPFPVERRGSPGNGLEQDGISAYAAER